MKHLKPASLSIGLALLVLSRAPAFSQDIVDTPVPAESKPAEKEAAVAKVEVHIEVTTTDGKPLPANSKVEISGQESTCGVLSSNDAFATIDANGKAVFREIPACKVTIKINVSLYIFLRTTVDLAEVKAPIALSLEPEK